MNLNSDAKVRRFKTHSKFFHIFFAELLRQGCREATKLGRRHKSCREATLFMLLSHDDSWLL